MRKRTTKQRILTAAVQILETSGVKGLTQPAVAKLVGISQGQLTYHYRKRTDLVLAVTQTALDQIAEFLWSTSPVLAARSFDKLLVLVMGLMKSETRVRAMLGLIVEADESAEVRSSLMDQGRKVRMLIATALQTDESDAEVTISHAVMLGFAIMFFMQRDSSERAKLETHFKESTKILMTHLKNRKALKKRK
jgi:AcrR family transcriptional regulator